MIKDFKIDDILNAVNSIYGIERKKGKSIKAEKDEFSHNNQVKSEKSDILVLDQMIE
tara:strand:- start:705 stop:875 length:171 start_codon:yes stop_codon:yes gene_type:complete